MSVRLAIMSWNIASKKRPFVSEKYVRKIRLLVTNQCSKNCSFCHNEGMPKNEEIHLNPHELEKYLPQLMRCSNKIVLSGGEPLEYKYLSELISILNIYDFDITVNTSSYDIRSLRKIIRNITCLHISITNRVDMDIITAKTLTLSELLVMTKVVFNIPIIDFNFISENIDRLYQLCEALKARIQFISKFDYGQKITMNWYERWKTTLLLLDKYNLSLIRSTPREVAFITSDMIQIDLDEIPCVASGQEFSCGECLDNSDIVIDPDMNVSICRWNPANNVPLTSVDCFDQSLVQAFGNSCNNCKFNSMPTYIYPQDIKQYMYLPHYKWPPDLSYLKNQQCFQVMNNNYSYFSKNGHISRFENEFAHYFDRQYALSVCSGTASLYLACLALNLSSEDEVIVPSLSFPTVVTALMTSGVKIRICDVNEYTGNIDIRSFCNLVNKNVKAVIITHLWGYPVDLDELIGVCHQKNIRIIEDCSHAFGSRYKDARVGTFGDIACFSLQANKTVVAGEGGILITADQELYERAVILSSSNKRIVDTVFKKENKLFWETGLGLKLKMHPSGAIYAIETLRLLDETNKKRNERMDIFNCILSDSEIMRPPFISDKVKKRVYYTYKPTLQNDFIPKQNYLIDILIKAGLQIASSSFIPIHRTPLFHDGHIDNNTSSFPNADKYYSRIISIPAFVNEPIELVRHYALRLKKALDVLEKGVD
jgi:dTDP-4-amino-4,6-dideoxygalactose transaminase/molybdenum cofactor biosynthesis enzyme MoaA